jgi:hypothetical protein
MKGIVTAGSVPYSVVVMLGLALYLMGHQSAKQPPRIAVAEKGAVILEAALANPTATGEKMKQMVTVPIRDVMRRYEQAGYVVINTSRNDEGDMTVDALPADTVDITGELRAAVHLPPQKPVAVTAAPAPAASQSSAGTPQ